MPLSATVSTPPPRTALQAATRALRARLRRGLMFMVALCTCIAVLLALIDGHFGAKLVYSFAIGLSCWAVTDGTRLAVAWAMDLRRARGGQAAPARPGFDIGWGGMIPLVVLSVVLGPTIGLAIGDALTGGQSPSLFRLGSRSTQITLAITVLGTLAAMVVLTVLERLSAARARAEAAQREAAEAQLMLLQSQLEPHMLFNTLANLRALIGADPPRAQAMLDRLIAFLRSTLAASRRDTHTLADEFARLSDYLALMAVRMGPRLQVRLELPPALAPHPVPPLLLQPLVENAIRHGLEPRVGDGLIEVRAAIEGDRLCLRVHDSGVGLDVTRTAGATGSGFGLHQVRERLATRYGGTAGLELAEAEGGGTLATVRLPLAHGVAS